MCFPSLDDLAAIERNSIDLREDYEISYDLNFDNSEWDLMPESYDGLSPEQKLAHYLNWMGNNDNL